LSPGGRSPSLPVPRSMVAAHVGAPGTFSAGSVAYSLHPRAPPARMCGVCPIITRICSSP